MSGIFLGKDAEFTALAEKHIRQATQKQLEASDPFASAFVSASAGSGKTKLLIDRLLRLLLPVRALSPKTGQPVLLEGVSPQRIVCLTFTRAAASEMQNRLRARLADFCAMPDEELGRALEQGLNVPDLPQTRLAARSLLGKILDLPGGMQIETIHSFCQSLLRRFPLEARLAPNFSLVEETGKNVLLGAAQSEVFAARSSGIDYLSLSMALPTLQEYIGDLSYRPEEMDALIGKKTELKRYYSRALDIAPDENIKALNAELLAIPEKAFFLREIPALLAEDAKLLSSRARDRLQTLLAACDETGDAEMRLALLESLAGYSPKIFNKKFQEKFPLMAERVSAELERLQPVCQKRRLVRWRELNLAVVDVGLPVFQALQAAKEQRFVLDYTDLLLEAEKLLRAAENDWIRYRLDGGIDHLLLDEVQDNSALQWEIIRSIAADFFSSGDDGRLRARTIFAVGDFKQSIYSFQGARPELFLKEKETFRTLVQSVEQRWHDPALEVSFRSTQPVLDFVNQLFSDAEISHGVREGEAAFPQHESARADADWGRVEVWPLEAPAEDGAEDPSPWNPGVAPPGISVTPQRSLARKIISALKDRLGKSPAPGALPLRPEEVMVLVRKRDGEFLPALLSGLRETGISVANFTDEKLVDSLLAQDLLNLGQMLLLPEDSLVFANFLVSPFGGLRDRDLEDLLFQDGVNLLKDGKFDSLHSILRERRRERESWEKAWTRFAALLGRADQCSPYELYGMMLGELGGRAAILGRLGNEADERIDAFLSALLQFEESSAPSLQGFLEWMNANQERYRRVPDENTRGVRVMTIHGAKGLESRLVILAQAHSPKGPNPKLLWKGDQDGLPFCVTLAGENPVWEKLKEEKAAEDRQEDNRLLYVALTRASEQLWICGWSKKKENPVQGWYEKCRAAAVLKGKTENVPEGKILGEPAAVIFEKGGFGLQAAAGGETAPPELPVPALPSWMGSAPFWRALPPPVPGRAALPLSPSRPEGIEYGKREGRSPIAFLSSAGLDSEKREQAMSRGAAIHRLMQFLPAFPPEERRKWGLEWLSRRRGLQGGFSVAEEALESVLAVFERPDLAPLFGPGSQAEQSIMGVCCGHPVIGAMDRLYVGEKEIWLADFKTGRVRDRLDQIPARYGRQMAIYADLLGQIYGGRKIRSFLIWTDGPKVMELSGEWLKERLPASASVNE